MKILVTEKQLEQIVLNKSELLSEEEVKYNPNEWNDNANKIYERLKQHRLPEKSIAAIMANLYIESRFKPTAIGDTKLKGGSSVGIAQWRESRKEGLINFAKQNNKNPNDIETQVDYLIHEINTVPSYSETKKAIYDPNISLADTTSTFTKNYEIPANKESEGDKRANIAHQMVSTHKEKFPKTLISQSNLPDFLKRIYQK